MDTSELQKSRRSFEKRMAQADAEISGGNERRYRGVRLISYGDSLLARAGMTAVLINGAIEVNKGEKTIIYADKKEPQSCLGQ